ncbi:MAG: transcriptional repressor LexA [Deinococcota bacterium]|nr:transcriptional repressor LexA [Deinococcota bacterium]
MKQPTKRQLEILRAVDTLRGELHRPPTLAELAGRIAISRQNTREHVWTLKELGYLNFKAQSRQSLTPTLTDKARALLASPGFAVLGSIAAGEPIYASEYLEGYTDRLTDLLPLQGGDFLLKVEGDSMTGVGYFPGDFVVVRPAKDILEGEIVVAFLPDEGTATLKRWYRQHGEVLLVAENPDYRPIRLPLEQVDVQGVVVGHIGLRRGRRSLRKALEGEKGA